MTSKTKPLFKGPRKSGNSKQTRVRKPFTDKARMNSGGFYRGMPGAHIEEFTIGGVKMDYRKMIQFVVSADGYATALLYAHNKHIKMAIEQAITHDKMLKGIIYSAVVDHMFRNKTIWNWPIRMRYRFIGYWTARKANRAFNKIMNHDPQEEIDKVAAETKPIQEQEGPGEKSQTGPEVKSETKVVSLNNAKPKA